ncbi:MAG: DUF1501 domain-containing protein, partial [Candidatus Binataceae bacterium]
ISEFGRTAHENGNAGTGHGHGNVMWLMGGPVRGGKVWGRWPRLSSGELYQARDRAVTTDFRDPVAEVLRHHMGLSEARVARVLPDAPRRTGNVGGIIREMSCPFFPRYRASRPHGQYRCVRISMLGRGCWRCP